MSYEFKDYFLDFVYFLIIIKLLRFDYLAKYLFITFTSIMICLSAFAMFLSVLMFPFIFLIKLRNEDLDFILKIFSLFTVILLFYKFRKKIYEFVGEILEEFKRDSNNLGRNLSSDIRKESDLKKLMTTYFDLVLDAIETQLFYSLSFFLILIFNLHTIYSYHYVFLPGFGFIEGFHINYDFSRWNLIWLLPGSVLLTYIYSNYYLSWVLNPIFEKFTSICVLIEKNKETVIMDRYFNLKIIENELIDESYEISEFLYFIKIKDDIFYIFEDSMNYRKFKYAYESIKVDGYKYFSIDFYKDFKY